MTKQHPAGVVGIVIHHTAGTDHAGLDMPSIRDFHVKVRGWDDIAYHEVFELVNGVPTKVSGRPWNRQGAHARGFNRATLGFVVVGDFTTAPPAAALLDFVALHTAAAMDALALPKTGALHPHKRVGTTKTACPGDRFPWDHFVSLVAQYRMGGQAR